MLPTLIQPFDAQSANALSLRTVSLRIHVVSLEQAVYVASMLQAHYIGL